MYFYIIYIHLSYSIGSIARAPAKNVLPHFFVFFLNFASSSSWALFFSSKNDFQDAARRGKQQVTSDCDSL